MSLFKKIISMTALILLFIPQVVFAEYESEFRITISTNQELYRINDDVEIIMQAENFSAGTITLDFSTGCQMGIEIFKNDEVVYNEELFPRNCNTTGSTVLIPSGKKAIWTRNLTKTDDGYPFTETARYKIHAFIMDHENEMFFNDPTSYTSFVFGEELLFSFNDIAEHWANTYIQKLSDQGFVDGYDDGGFHPNSNINRAEMVKLALVSAGYDFNISTIDPAFRFNDLDDWQKKYVYKAWESGIIEGYDEFTFDPAKNVTRAEAVKIALLAFNIEPGNLEGDYAFEDTIDHWAAPYINEAYAKFIISGYEDGNFHPNEPITRAEAAKVISLLIEL